VRWIAMDALADLPFGSMRRSIGKKLRKPEMTS
jgi:hypothetical protein